MPTVRLMHTNATSYEDESIAAFWDDQDGDDQNRAEIEEERRAESKRAMQQDRDDHE